MDIEKPPDAPHEDAAAELCRRGRERLRAHDVGGYREAVALLLEARETDPSLAAAHAGLAEAYALWGFRRALAGQEADSFFDLAFESACAALELAPDSPEPHRAMAAALRAGPHADPEARRREAQAAFDLNPYDPESCWELWRARGHAPADPLIYRALAIDPELCGAHIDLGAAFCEARRLEEAAYHLRKALELRPTNALAAYDLAMVLLRQGLGADAAALLEEALRRHPGDPMLARARAVIDEERSGAEAAA